MARLLKNILSFALFFGVFYVVLLLSIALSTTVTFKVESSIFRHNKISGNELRRIQEFHAWLNTTGDSKKALILGSSTAYMNIDPSILEKSIGADVFNCGTNAQTIDLSEDILGYAVEHCKIDYVLLDVVPVLWDYSSPEPVIAWTTHNPYLASKFMLTLVASVQSVTVWNHYFYFLAKRCLPLARYDKEENLRTRVYKTKGHVCIDDTVRTGYAHHTVYKTMTAENTRALQNITDICRRKNIQLIISIPKVLNADIEENLVYADGYPVVDAASFDIDSMHFKDSHHMFCTGAEKYSQWLSVKLKGYAKQE